jgi:YVTN family beta-propeller protein
MLRSFVFALACLSLSSQDVPRPIEAGFFLPNGWKITPTGRSVQTEDMVLNMTFTPDRKSLVAIHSGFNPHGLVVIDRASEEVTQRIPLKSSWYGLAWSPDGKRLFVSGGNAVSRRDPGRAPIHVFEYAGGKLGQVAVKRFEETIPADKIYWSGLVHHPSKPILYAANRGTGNTRGEIVLFNSDSGAIQGRIPTEINPYDVILSPDSKRLYVSNWASASVSVIDTESNKTIATIATDRNPNDMTLAKDGRLYVACANDNSVTIIDTEKLRAVEKISTAMHRLAPEGATPNFVQLDPTEKVLFVANADNNNVAVISVAEREASTVMGFIPTGWYPSSLAVEGTKLYVGNSKGVASYPNIRGPQSPLPDGDEGKGSVKSLQKGSVEFIDIGNLRGRLKELTKKAFENSPYNDDLLSKARPAAQPSASVVPRETGQGSPIKHVLYIIKENRTYDQVLGDMPRGNNDPRLTIFGRKVTPNHHALAEQFVHFDNLYCDGEVSVDGHSWSNSAYATDFNEKLWPPNYGGHSQSGVSFAYTPAAGQLWDQAARKGLTYRSYGEYATRNSEGTMQAAPGVNGLVGHVAPRFKLQGMRDTDNAKEFLREFDEYERNYESANPEKRLPNYIVMSLGEDHTVGTRPGLPTPRAAVASNDYALGIIVERITKSRYWPETAIFVIEDDAQDGPDHVDARRTVALAISPYIKRGMLDSTLYTTSSMLRTIELLLGLQPMSQFDAAAMPMYAAFGTTPDLKPYTKLEPTYPLEEKNTAAAWGAKASLAMDFSDYDRTPMFELNEIVWKSVNGPRSEMPLPVRRYHFR